MNILIIGNGGREHALAWKAASSPLAEKIFVAPGNAGTALEQSITNINIAATDIPALVAFAKQQNIGLTIVGPEVSLVKGIVDVFNAAGLRVFGPTQAAAQLEGSKTFTKEFLARHHIPTGFYQNFTEIGPAINYVQQQGVPIVIKADGLAAGKGVIVAITLAEAESAIKDILVSKMFGEAGHRIVIEEFLRGEEVSFIVMVDGKHVLPMATSQDYKRVGDGDTGLNTGGMGAYSPAPVVTNQLYNQILDQIILPTVKGMAWEDNPYTGFLYAGLMITPEGQPKVLEFNCRLGDPETQTIMFRMRSDLVAHCLAATEGCLDQEISEWDERCALSVVLASGGYPGDYRIGYEISGLPTKDSNEEKVFHAGTCLEQGKILTQSGRVLCVTALGYKIAEAQARVYQVVDSIHWQNSFYRRDIGYRVGVLPAKLSKT
ncbi:phosphoribosylamine--glycine ligase [Candidatus Palibaumannia cicadellinicola]|uniref:Phosphoribosylamine--glycine ligase n=1 Tax=Candidatus Palibaumannia cicadellinicola TaxID=186490 RepID=A0A2N4XW67_9GAMM|nr:phosphoribosylamine--glycine ligase [Candidatus Baumannia cicadellinicola]PLK58194.1 phosphoribosylamine--glycine ligase [Candidatus Baumannia cicadellinicola]